MVGRKTARGENLQIESVEYGLKHEVTYWNGSPGYDWFHYKNELEENEAFASKRFQYQAVTDKDASNNNVVLNAFKAWVERSLQKSVNAGVQKSNFDPRAKIRSHLRQNYPNCYKVISKCKNCGKAIIP